MSNIDYYKREIERCRSSIDKFNIEIKKLREKKKRKREYYSKYIKKATNPYSRQSRKNEKIRVLSSIDRDINYKQTSIEKTKIKIKNIREKIKKERNK